jgi:acyl carrier protein
MPNIPMQSIDERIAGIVTQLLAERAPAYPIPADAPLTAAGLNSLDMVNLLLEIEASFEVTIPARMVSPKSFRTIGSIARLIEGLAIAA